MHKMALAVKFCWKTPRKRRYASMFLSCRASILSLGHAQWLG